MFQSLIVKPKHLFLIDGLGALVSAFFLGVVLVQWESHFGMPSDILYVLAILVLIFACYSNYCYIFFPQKWKTYLTLITVINALYCCLTLALVVHFYHELTFLGLVYFIGEIIVIVLLVRIETLAILKH